MKRVLMLLVVVSLSSLSCKEEKPIYIDKSSTIDGIWVVNKAVRDDKVTESLNGGFLKITDTKIESNFLPGLSSENYDYSNHKIIVSDGKISFKVRKLTSNELMLSTRLNHYHIELEFAKSDTIPTKNTFGIKK